METIVEDLKASGALTKPCNPTARASQLSLKPDLLAAYYKCELSCLSCLVHSHMLVPAVTFSPQAPSSADLLGTARVSAPLGKVSEWIVLAFRCTVRFLPEAALL